MINWPASLVAEIAERRAIIVMGAGASAGSLGADGNTRPPDWKTLLTEGANLMTDASAKTFALDLISKEKYLDAAELIVRSVNVPDLSAFIRTKFQTPGFEPSEIHKLVLEFDVKVVITTNYDEIYENYCKRGRATTAYNVCRHYERHSLNDLRSTTRSILKIHGCVSDPTQILFSRTQYFEARQSNPRFFNVIDALFLTNTLLFIGCSLVDPDLHLLLETAHLRTETQHPHYAVIEAGRPPALLQALKDVHNVMPLEYAAGQHNEVVAALKQLRDDVSEWRRTHP